MLAQACAHVFRNRGFATIPSILTVLLGFLLAFLPPTRARASFPGEKPGSQRALGYSSAHSHRVSH